MGPMTDKGGQTRIDRWLWATRRFKTRSGAATACTGGKVKLNGESAKPASRVRVGDTITIRRSSHSESVRVEQIIEKRVSAARAADTFTDTTPESELEAARQARDARRSDALAVPVYARRAPGAGRPTKRDRRKLDRLRGTSRKSEN